MPTKTTLPPDSGSPLRKMIDRWDALWHARYRYPSTSDRDDQVAAAPGYTRSFSRLVSGLFMRQSPTYDGATDGDTGPMAENELAELLAETTSKAAGYGHVLLRPIYDGARWAVAVVAPTRFAVKWAHRRPLEVKVWDFAPDPRKPDDKSIGLAFVETWTPGEDNAPGAIVTEVWETSTDPVTAASAPKSPTEATGGVFTVTAATGGGKIQLVRQVDLADPPAQLAEHPFVTSAANDITPRDVAVFVWAWEDLGPVPLWYTNEDVIDGLARLWDQEQDDAEMTRKRVAMPAEALGRARVYADGTQDVIARPGFNKHDNILLLSSRMSAEHGSDGGVTPIEFDDDLVQRDRIERRENALLESVGINPSSIGRHVGGRSDSGEAKRADNQMTMNTITLPARSVERSLTTIVSEIGRLNSTSKARSELVVKVREGLKEDAGESAENAQALRDADAASTRTLVATAHPTWDATQIDAEVELMQSEGTARSAIEL